MTDLQSLIDGDEIVRLLKARNREINHLSDQALVTAVGKETGWPWVRLSAAVTYAEGREAAFKAILSLIQAGDWRLVPVDDPERDFSDSALPLPMIKAGELAVDAASLDLANYTPGKTIDWDSGMIAVAVYRAMLNAAPTPPVSP